MISGINYGTYWLLKIKMGFDIVVVGTAKGNSTKADNKATIDKIQKVTHDFIFLVTQRCNLGTLCMVLFYNIYAR